MCRCSVPGGWPACRPSQVQGRHRQRPRSGLSTDADPAATRRPGAFGSGAGPGLLQRSRLVAAIVPLNEGAPAYPQIALAGRPGDGSARASSPLEAQRATGRRRARIALDPALRSAMEGWTDSLQPSMLPGRENFPSRNRGLSRPKSAQPDCYPFGEGGIFPKEFSGGNELPPHQLQQRCSHAVVSVAEQVVIPPPSARSQRRRRRRSDQPAARTPPWRRHAPCGHAQATCALRTATNTLTKYPSISCPSFFITPMRTDWTIASIRISSKLDPNP